MADTIGQELKRVRERYDPLNIHSPKGTRVTPVFLDGKPFNGYAWDRKQVERLLKEGEVYTVDRIEIHSSYSTVFLEEIPDTGFNSICLAPVHEDGELSNHDIQNLAEQNVRGTDDHGVGKLLTKNYRRFYADGLKLARDRKLFPTGPAIEAGWKCSNAAMVLHDRYKAEGDHENAAICKRISQEWRESLGAGRVWTADEVNAILGEAERQVESMTDGKIVPSFAGLAQKHGLQ